MNLLYVLGPAELSKWQNNELRYSLRSFEPFGVDWVGITGPQVPPFLSGIHHTYVAHADGSEGNRYRNTQRQILAACLEEQIPEDLVLMNDDFMTRGLDKWNWTPTHRGIIRKRDTPNMWKRTIFNTATLMEQKGISNPINYEGHTPFLFQKSKAIPLLEEMLQSKEILQFRTAYGNVNHIGGRLWPNAKRADPDEWPSNFPFLSLSGDPKDKMKRFLQRWLTTPSRWEVSSVSTEGS